MKTLESHSLLVMGRAISIFPISSHIHEESEMTRRRGLRVSRLSGSRSSGSALRDPARSRQTQRYIHRRRGAGRYTQPDVPHAVVLFIRQAHAPPQRERDRWGFQFRGGGVGHNELNRFRNQPVRGVGNCWRRHVREKTCSARDSVGSDVLSRSDRSIKARPWDSDISVRGGGKVIKRVKRQSKQFVCSRSHDPHWVERQSLELAVCHGCLFGPGGGNGRAEGRWIASRVFMYDITLEVVYSI